ncbi:MAG: response regulator, partial [Gammaproteobacteria bacterium]
MPEKGLNKRARLQALRDAYSAGLGGRLADIEAGWALLRREPDNVDRHSELHRQVHSLAGSAATFGYRQLGRLARDLEQLLSAAVDGTTLTTAAQATDIPARLAELRTVSERGPDEPLTPEVSPATRRRTEPGQVYVIEDDPQQAAETATQLGAYGWQVTTFANAAEALARLRHTLPAALVVDQVLSEGELAGSSLLEQVEAVAEYRVPRIVVSSRRDWQSRLAAARAGADAYLVKPLDFSELAATLDTLTDRHEREPYRVLIVDDTVDLAEHYAEVLGSAGMQVKVINEPAGLLDTLTEFRPELILMDLYMPGCSGIEAARVIRQEPEYLSVPIVFLSTEAGRERQLAAMETGADDFLEKPIADDQLIAV